MSITFFVSGSDAECRLLDREARAALSKAGLSGYAVNLVGSLESYEAEAVANSLLELESDSRFRGEGRLSRKALQMAKVAGFAEASNQVVKFG